MTTEKDKTYNGWTNYETWAVKLWMDNDEGSQEHYSELAQEAYDDSDEQMASDGKAVLFTKAERATLNLSARLEVEFEEGERDLLERAGVTCSVWADLLGAALGEVNWHEIAGHYIDEVDKSEEAPCA